MTVNTQLLDLPGTTKALIVENEDDSFTIILNSRLCYEVLKESYEHEIKHIENSDFEGFDVDVIEYISHEVNYG